MKRGRPALPSNKRVPVSTVLAALNPDQIRTLVRVLHVKDATLTKPVAFGRGRPRTLATPVKLGIAVAALRKAKVGGADKVLALAV